MKKFTLKSGNKTSFKEMGATEAIKQVDTSSTGYPNQDKSKMRTEKEIYKAKLRGDYMDLTGEKGKASMRDDPTGQVMSRDPHYLDSPAKHVKLDKDSVSVKHEHADKRPPKPKWGEKESPAKQAIGGGAGEALAHHKEYIASEAALKGAKQGVKKVASKSISNIAGKALGGLGIAATLYDFYKSGQKHSGGKAVKGQKSFMAESKKKTKSIFKK